MIDLFNFKKNKNKTSCMFCKTDIDISKVDVLEEKDEKFSHRIKYIICPLCKQKIIIKYK